MPIGEEHLEAPADPHRRLGVDEAEAAEPVVAGHGVAGDQPTAVVADEGDAVHTDVVDSRAEGIDVALDRDLGVLGEAARAGADVVDEVTGHVVDQVWEQAPEGRPTHGPPVGEHDIGAGADLAVRDPAVAHVDERVRRLPEEFGGIGAGEWHRGAPFVMRFVVVTAKLVTVTTTIKPSGYGRRP